MIDPSHDTAEITARDSLLTPQEHRLLKESERMRAGGMLRFILLRGVLGWGGCMAVSIVAYRFIVDGPRTLGMSLHYFVAFTMGGFFFGLLLWFSIEIKYRRLIKKMGLPLPPPICTTEK